MKISKIVGLVLVASLVASSWAGAGEKPAAKGKKKMAIDQVKGYITEKKVDTSKDGWRTSLPKYPEVEFAAGENYYWNLETNEGPIKVKFLPEVAPNHVANFLYLTELGYFDGLSFHRVISSFMAQGGCPLGSGTGSPGYKFGGEFDPSVKHDRPGLLSMANAGPGTDGSQFFLTFVETPWLDGKHTIFGEVVEGMDTLKALESKGSRSGRTSEPLSMGKASISHK